MDIIRIIYHTLSRGARALMLDGGVDIIRIIHHTVDTLGYIFAQDKTHLGSRAMFKLGVRRNRPLTPWFENARDSVPITAPIIFQRERFKLAACD